LILKWNGLETRKALAELLRSEQMRISLGGPKRDTQVAEVLLYYMLGFDVEKERPLSSITIDAESAEGVSAFDHHIVVRHFKSLDDAQALIFRFDHERYPTH
jgi:hypothetical protein